MKKYEPTTYGVDDLVNYLHAKLAPHRVTRAVIKEMIDGETEFIRLILLDGDKVNIPNLGRFGLRYAPPKEAREMRNPYVSMDKNAPPTVWVEASDEHNRVGFKPSKSFKEVLREKTYGDAYVYVHEDDDEEVDELDGEETISE